MSAPEALTYDSLVNDIINYAERSDEPFLDQIPRFIMLTEQRLASEVRGLGYLRVVSTTVSGATLAKPARWRETKSFAITVAGSMTFLQSRSYQYCRAFNPTGATGIPRYYSDEDYDHWYLAAVPAIGYAAEIQYHERPDPLSPVQQTSWTTQFAPQLLLYGTLLEAQPFLKLGERIPEFQNLFDRALLMLAKEDDKRRGPDSSAVRG